MKKDNNWIFIFLLFVIAIGILIIALKPFNQNLQDETVTYVVEKTGGWITDIDAKTGERIKKYEFVYDCNDNGKEIVCDGTINYMAKNSASGGIGFGMDCYKEYEGTKQCINRDVLRIDYMSSDNNQVDFQLKCDYGDNKNFKIQLGFDNDKC